MILLEGADWWTASWFGAEARGSTPLEAIERLCGRLRSVRMGEAMPTAWEDLEALHAAWPVVREVVARVLSRTPEPPERPLSPWERPSVTAIAEATEAAERRVVRAALEEERGNLTRASRRLGLSRFGLLKKVRRLNLYQEAKAMKWRDR